ncbi:flavin reductase family protein [Streptomyces pseudovenezuelae]|uniref:Flavin reductase (DIM6/NTAB) family NADH-FMN oxidoreductase RutF n=1 Tax=Streptomyces pseudovenezuelae TaxID=67350 RepID=A0ABT6LZ63_9ACTN|nr:flavin reductase family protein [Streptomyces pseudovenezuelae]MDH6221596.1 flavin reductase (DIM6/NTAB) family NADH-FMN oxidoreductase RutF [Streptomyces pseudovenezuelae]
MSRDIPDQLWKKLTSTVGLVAVRSGGAINVMSAEWSYFVNKTPLYAAVVLGPSSESRQLLPSAGEFSLTLCSEEQAGLADFAGSFSLSEIDKSSSELLEFGEAESTRTPWVRGGLIALECILRDTVCFPVHRMYVGEVSAVHVPDHSPRPLVKHGPLHALGMPVHRTAVVAGAQVLDGPVLRVAATGPDASEPPDWRVRLLVPGEPSVDLGMHPSGEYGDLLVDLPLPPAPLAGARIKVERTGAEPGYARLDSRIWP